MLFKKIIFNVFISIILFYILLGVILFFSQNSLLYYPNNQDFYECEGFKNYEKLEFNNTRFYFLQGSQKDKIIIYYHGNAGSACDRSIFKSTFEQSNASLIFVEYTGYSNDTVKPSKKLILKDVENIYNYLNDNDYKKVIVYGQSIGSAAASYHSYLGNVDILILVTPFSRLDDLVQSKIKIYPSSILLREKYDNVFWLNNYNGSLLIIHSDNDLVIPKQFSQELFKEVSTKDKNYILIEGKGHNEIGNSYLFQNTLIKYLNN